MAGVKISDLPILDEEPDNLDLIVVVDTDEDTTKQITVGNLLSSALNAASSAQVDIDDSAVNAAFFLTFVSSTAGSQVVTADPDLTYNPVQNILTAGFFEGDGSLLTGVLADSAATATFALTSGDALANAIDSATGLRITGETTIDSDLIVRGTIFGDGSGLTNIPAEALNSQATLVSAKILNDSSGVHYLMLRNLQTGMDSVNTTSYLTYDPQTFTLSAQNFSGDGSSLTNVAALSATNAANVAVTAVTDSATYYLHLGSTTSGNDNVNTNIGLTYNPFREKLSTGVFATDNWEMYESANELFFAYNGVKKAKIDASGNMSIAGTLTESASL